MENLSQINIEVPLQDVTTGKPHLGIIKEICLEHEDEYMCFQENVIRALKDKSQFVAMTREEFRAYLSKYKAVSLALFVEEHIYGAWFTVAYGNEEGSLAKDIGLMEHQAHLNCNYETAILSPRFRGQGLNSMMSKIMTTALTQRGFQYLSATVEPSNYSSMGSILKDGYRIVDRKLKYGGYDRYIFLKQLHAPQQLTAESITIKASDKQQIEQLLKNGYVGTNLVKTGAQTLLKLHKKF